MTAPMPSPKPATNLPAPALAPVLIAQLEAIAARFPPPRVARLHIPADAPGDEAPKDAKFCAIELQDGAPSRALSVSGQVVLAGVNLLLPTPADRTLIDVAGGELLLLGCGLGDAEVGPVPKVRAAVGAQVLSLGCALETRGPAAPFVGPVLDRASRALDRDQLGHWPNQVQFMPEGHNDG